MANELKIRISASYKDPDTGAEWSRTWAEQSIDVSGEQYLEHIQSVGTSEEAITLGDITTGGWVFVENLDPTNFVEIRSGTGTTDVVKVLAGETCAFRMSGDSSAPFAIADTAACKVRFTIFPA